MKSIKLTEKQKVIVIPFGIFNLVLGVAVSVDGSMWFDDCSDGRVYHIVSIQSVKKEEITALQFVLLWFRLIVGIA